MIHCSDENMEGRRVTGMEIKGERVCECLWRGADECSRAGHLTGMVSGGEEDALSLSVTYRSPLTLLSLPVHPPLTRPVSCCLPQCQVQGSIFSSIESVRQSELGKEGGRGGVMIEREWGSVECTQEMENDDTDPLHDLYIWISSLKYWTHSLAHLAPST